MNDVLTVALERRRELRERLAEIDEFISMAESLLRNATSKPGPDPDRSGRPDQRDRPERTEHAEPRAARSKPSERPQIVEIPDAAPEPVVRKFPWSNSQPPVRRTGADEAGPVRRTVMRREAS